MQEGEGSGKVGCLGLKTSRADGWSGSGADVEHSCWVKPGLQGPSPGDGFPGWLELSFNSSLGSDSD